jgi:HAD superfamily hydrolase (TIGR01459 family)
MKDLSARFPVWLSDVWGVVHDGQRPIASAVAALQRHRAQGGKVVLITNAPRPMATIQTMIDRIGVARDAYDALVTSGDVTRALMVEHGPKGLFHLGPQIDLPLFNALAVERVGLAEAGAVICTGYPDDGTDHAALLPTMKARGLVMICANPDKVVRIGGQLVRCAGSIAAEYEAIGGRVLMAGKPFAPIYDLALDKVGRPARHEVLAIGDGPETDIAGAAASGFAAVFISGGINDGPDVVDEVRRTYPSARILKAMPELKWS